METISSSANSAAVRSAWADAIDATAAMTSTEALHPASEYTPNSYMPPLPSGWDNADFFAQLRELDKTSAEAAASFFFPQMTPEEACHAKPSFYQTFRGEREVTETSFQPPVQQSRRDEEDGDTTGNRHGSRRRRQEASQPQGTAPLYGGFLGQQAMSPSTAVQRKPDFMPILLVPSAPTAPLQLINIKQFLERGAYVDPASLYIDQETGVANIRDSKPHSVVVRPGSFHDPHKYHVAFRQFRVVDDADEVDDWSHVCGCIVEGKLWQLQGWYPAEPPQARTPSRLFTRIRAFLAYFEEDKVPPQCREWNVYSLPLTRNLLKDQVHIALASHFWENLYTYLDEHPMFRRYTIPLTDERL
ncbi:putative RNA polymerase-associated protein CDC73 [Leptomonas seymouri]|uniref:Putative RNA polymerase-associated protein CDC73 n=1 Tax=Leptomonas seymouri TaxID=5684 RepID=A0A0N1I5W1_LEPSE|nr:putative RNA polymerase-associated protein CDC73 [Leptomonas seymouri]|eukprot:KPI87288.1 putative RNA polymerase-associated protein CDC73 [Leptomonas seymouri]